MTLKLAEIKVKSFPTSSQEDIRGGYADSDLCTSGVPHVCFIVGRCVPVDE